MVCVLGAKRMGTLAAKNVEGYAPLDVLFHIWAGWVGYSSHRQQYCTAGAWDHCCQASSLLLG
jgi:hypothetical protein